MFMGMNTEERLKFRTLAYNVILNQRIINYLIGTLSKKDRKEINKIEVKLEKEMKDDKSYQSLKKEVKEDPFSCMF